MEFGFFKGMVCPLCAVESISRNGNYNDKQRYIRASHRWGSGSSFYGYSIRKSAEILGINIATSFFWRHKILDCLKAINGISHVDDVVETDEVYFAESFKGTKPSEKPGKSCHRGSELRLRGISNEQVCVSTAIELKKIYGERIGEDSILCTDSHSGYIKFSKGPFFGP